MSDEHEPKPALNSSTLTQTSWLVAQITCCLVVYCAVTYFNHLLEDNMVNITLLFKFILDYIDIFEHFIWVLDLTQSFICMYVVN